METTTKKELEELLPDYVLNRLEGDIKAKFEANVIAYEDLVKEIEDAKAVFKRLDAMEFYKGMEILSKNVSVRVMNRLDSPPQNRLVFIMKYVVPSLALVFIAFGAYFYPKTNSLINNPKIKPFEISNVQCEDIIKALGDSVSNEELANIAPNAQIEAQNAETTLQNISEESSVNFVNQEIGTSLANFIDKNYNSTLINQIEANFNPNDNFENISEEDFTKIYEDLKNEKFHS